MTIDPALLVAFLGALLGLLGLFLRGFFNGDLLSKHTVRREDYDRVLAINEGYAAKFGEQTESVRLIGQSQEKLVGLVSNLLAGMGSEER